MKIDLSGPQAFKRERVEGGGGRIPSNFQLSFIMENCRGFFTAGNYVWGEGEEIALIKIINSNFTSK